MNKEVVRELLGKLWRKSKRGSVEESLFRELWYELGNDALDEIIERASISYNITQSVLGIQKKKSLGILLTKEERDFYHEYSSEFETE